MTPKSRLTAEELATLAEPIPPEGEAPARADSTSPASSAKATRGGAKKAEPRPQAEVKGEDNLEVRQEIAKELFQEMFGEAIEWQDGAKGICPCPNREGHSGSSKTECVIWIDGEFTDNRWPTLRCAHSGCQENAVIKSFNYELRSRIGKAERGDAEHTPSARLIKLYPGLAEACGEPFNFVGDTSDKDGPAVWTPLGLNERFFASLLTQEANQHDPAVFDQDENWWLRYNPDRGFYAHVKPEALHEPLDRLLLQTAQECAAPRINTTPLQFRFRSTRSLSPIIAKASGLCAVRSAFWKWPVMKLPVKNGVLDLASKTLTPHSSDWHFRSVIGVDFVPGWECPEWLEFLKQVQSPENIDLLQRILGLVLLGHNLAQVMTILSGEARSGKGTFIRMATGLIGPENVGTLRTGALEGRFEMGRHRHKRLVYGPDVTDDFLSREGAAVLKAMTGEDPISPEYKGSNETPAAEPLSCSIILTTNTRLRVRFQGDKEAWRRRLILIPFERAVPESEVEAGLSGRLLATESPGILNWALEGAKKVSVDKNEIRLTDAQKKVRDTLLEESESYVAFAREGVVKDEVADLTTEEAYRGFVRFCAGRGWAPLTPQVFRTGFKQAVVDLYGITQSHDLVTVEGKHGRGWHGLRLQGDQEDERRAWRAAYGAD